MPSTTNPTVLMLALISLAASEIQITQPASKAMTLALQPDPVVHWVYSSSDPGLVSILIRQVETDEDYEPMLALHHGATAVSQSSVPIPLSTIKFEEGMNITIEITEVTEENQNVPLEQRVLASRGPLRLVEGSNGIQPMGPTGQSSSSTSTSDPSSPSLSHPHTSDSTNTDSASTDSSNTAEATRTNDSLPSPTSEDTAAAATTTQSDADKHDTVTTLYVLMLIVTAIPAFLFGFNP